jgi:histidine triad (HIT) family protein
MYNHAPADYICPFCLVAQGVENEHVYTTQSDIVYRTKSVTAFISSHQWPKNHGNVIIIPNAHYEHIYDLPVSYAAKIHEVTQKVALALKVVYGCDGVSTRQHNEPAGSQDVWHYHLHVTPRYHGDELYATLTTQRQRMAVEERARLAERVRVWLAQHAK